MPPPKGNLASSLHGEMTPLPAGNIDDSHRHRLDTHRVAGSVLRSHVRSLGDLPQLLEEVRGLLPFRDEDIECHRD